jgi:NADPH:quinone reductase-like Zn-dependent oxidoreductase
MVYRWEGHRCPHRLSGGRTGLDDQWAAAGISAMWGSLLGCRTGGLFARTSDASCPRRRPSLMDRAGIPIGFHSAGRADRLAGARRKGQCEAGTKSLHPGRHGGVGSFAIQLAKHLGATVATTASAANFELVKALGADILIDYKHDDFETVLHEYDVVLHSQDSATLDKSLRVLKPGGKLISISGPPDPAFAEEIGAPWFVKLIMRALSFDARRKAKRLNVTFSFLFMRANGDQLSELTPLIDQGVIHPVVERVFPFESTKDALDFVESGRAKGRVVVKVS